MRFYKKYNVFILEEVTFGCPTFLDMNEKSRYYKPLEKYMIDDFIKKNVDDSEKFYDYYHFSKNMDVFYEIRRICKENNILKDLNNQIEILRIKSFRLRKNGKNTTNERNKILHDINIIHIKFHKIILDIHPEYNIYYSQKWLNENLSKGKKILL